MTKAIIIATATAFLFATPAFAQDAGHPAGFDGPHGSATNLRDAPRPDTEPSSMTYLNRNRQRDLPPLSPDSGFDGRHGSATNLRDTPSSDQTAARPHHPAFNGPHGSASDFTDRPSSDSTAVRGQYRQLLHREPQADAANGHVKVFDGKTGAELRSAPQDSATGAKPGRRPGFEGPHGSPTNLRDTPPSDPTAGYIRPATLYGRKAGDDKRQDYSKPAPRPSRGLTKAGTGTLTLSNGN